jgi:hypothetical protein
MVVGLAMALYTPITELLEMPLSELFSYNKIVEDIMKESKKGK